jgi:hypothetical protein
MAQLTNELSCFHYGISRRLVKAAWDGLPALQAAGQRPFLLNIASNPRLFCPFWFPNTENRIKCGSDAVFPQQSWYKMAHIAANQKSSIEEDSWLQV